MRLLRVIALLSLPLAASAQSGSGPYGNTYTVTTLAPGIHTLTWRLTPGVPAIGNSTFIVGDKDVIAIDTGLSLRAGETILGALRQVTTKPVSMVINTHWHGDHTAGNQAFRTLFPSARFVAHPATREGIVTGESDYRDANRPKTLARIAELKGKTSRSEDESRELTRAEMQIEAWEGEYVLPDVLVDSHLTIVQDARRIELLHLGAANTKGDLVVHLPAERIVVSGDMAITPVPFAFFSSPRAWVGTLDRLASLDVAMFVPGHGPVQTSPKFIRDLQVLLRSVIDQVDAGVKAGLDLAALKESVKLTAPEGSVYAAAPAGSLDRLFRIPAIESALKERE